MRMLNDYESNKPTKDQGKLKKEPMKVDKCVGYVSPMNVLKKKSKYVYSKKKIKDRDKE